ncbi:SixA phosphatase family protein [Leptospira haakeii]|uniref:Phosphohistidine phosphatase n=1 Tax=Leptospira haakeii TaxID=2023198 RepID=A0ABX4PQ48_9LEPT|nr:histidine phosphatase family protein [Leptospira haakeii]PKA17718.1 phosphohistidine phosphatase [Leptospira haakeii]PKA21443.1 phosphohistidine phosphatase [Leptospira haakeii]
MKEIHLIRHSKSDWSDTNLKDKERPLSKRGRKNARFLGKYVEKVSFVADVALISPSIRTSETWKILQGFQNITKDTKIISEIYEAEYSDLLRILRGLASKINNVVLIGHNPGMEDLANYLLLGNNTDSLFEKFPTSSFISLVTDQQDWADLGRQSCRLKRFWIP